MRVHMINCPTLPQSGENYDQNEINKFDDLEDVNDK